MAEPGAPTTPLSATPLIGPQDGAGARPPAGEGRFLPGTMLAGRYRLVALLGRGGMGEVYRAEDTKLGQTVALKFLPPAHARDPQSLERFYAEVRVGRQVSHPNVCRLYDLVEIDGHHCLSMEYVDGEDLATLLKRIGRLPADKAIDIAREICAGLAAAHDKGVIHRDLKPANVMIDGRGRTRITDFGLAAFAEDIAREALAGTPAYMAPEQLDGQPASIQSDIYALGLLLYETFTGKRLFDARTLNELKALHAQAKPPSLSSSVRDIPVEVERVVQRCLEENPGARPASVHAVIAALPGGDPLQAALAAGETPSPAMVAAAGKVGELPLAVAWTFLLSALLGLVLIAHLSARTTVLGRLRPDLPPEALAAKAHEILGRLGYAEQPVDSAGWYWFDLGYLGSIADQPSSLPPWTTLAAARPGPLIYVYRQSPRVLVAEKAAQPFVLPSEIGRIDRNDPPMAEPGMLRLVMDRRGWLTELVAVPPEIDSGTARGAVDWSIALDAAGLRAADLASVPSRRPAPVDSDAKLAWDGAYPDQPDVPLHIEAAAYRGKPVWFDVRGPWEQPNSRQFSAFESATFVVVLLFGIVILVTVTAMLRRNLRQGRGDRRGALRLGVAILASLSLALLLRADHVASLFDEDVVLVNVLSQSLYFAAGTWLLYLAFEPYARRRWPALMISWSRLLAGRLRDPMVGRDLLLGGLVGVVLCLLIHGSVLLPSGFGHTQRAPMAQVVSPLNASRHLIFFLLVNVYTAMTLGLASLFGLFVTRGLLRIGFLALGVQFAFTYLFFVVATRTDPAWSPILLLFALIWFAVLIRVGLLPAIVSVYFYFVLQSTPLTLDFSAWYSSRMLLCFGVLGAVLVYAFHTSLAGKSPLGRLLSE